MIAASKVFWERFKKHGKWSFKNSSPDCYLWGSYREIQNCRSLVANLFSLLCEKVSLTVL